jgi:hypothetical protein
MEVKIQLLAIIPSVKELKENSSDIISIVFFYENNQFYFNNIEKAISNKENKIFKVIIKNQIPSLNMKISLIRNSDIISSSNFIISNDSKWITLTKVKSCFNYQKNNSLIKIHLKCQTKNNRIFKEKENFLKNNYILTSREKKHKINDEKLDKRIINFKECINKKNINNFEKMNNSQNLETEFNYYLKKDEKLKKNISFHELNSNLKKEKKAFSIKYNFRKRNFIENENEKEMKHNSQIEFKVNGLEKLNESNEEKIHERKLSKLEDDIINYNYKNSIKNDLYIKKDLNHMTTSSLIQFTDNNQENIFSNQDTFELKKKEFFSYYTKEYILNIDNDMLKLETQIILEKIFDLLNHFNLEKKEILNNYKIYKETFNEFSFKYIYLSKKYDKLKKKIRKIDIINIENEFNKNFLKHYYIKKEPKLVLKEINLWKNVINNCNLIDNMEKIRKNQLKEIFLNITFPIKDKLNSLSKKFVNELHDKKTNLEYSFSNEFNNSLFQTSNSFYSKNTIGTSSSTLISTKKKKKFSSKIQKKQKI